MKKQHDLSLNEEIVNFPELLVKGSDLSKDIGKRCVFVNPKCPAEFDVFTVCAVQKIYDGSLAYRVVGEKDVHRFGRTAKQAEVRFL